MTFDKLSEQDDAGAFVLIQDKAEPESSTAHLMKRLSERKPYYPALEFDERHPSYASLIRLRDDASWRRRVEEAWARYLTRYRKGVAGHFDILIDLPEEQRLPGRPAPDPTHPPPQRTQPRELAEASRA